MEKLSNSELIRWVRADTDYDLLSDRAQIELLSRLESGDRAKQTIKELIPMINKMLEGK